MAHAWRTHGARMAHAWRTHGARMTHAWRTQAAWAKTSHLLWGCDKVLELWQQIHYFLSNFQISLDYSLKTVLFGNHNEPCDSVLNFTILIAKGYIWKSKFDKSPISFIAFKKYFKHKLEDLKDSCNYIDKMFLFDRWINIYASL